MDETWIHHFSPEPNWPSAEWTAAGESHLKWPKTQTSVGKVLASIFWDAQAMLFINYFEKGIAINCKYYKALLVHLKKEIKKKWPKIKKKKWSFTKTMHCVTSWSQWWQTTWIAFRIASTPTYSLDLVPSDYWLFAHLKRVLPGKRFGSNEEVISETESYFEAKNKSFYKKGIKVAWYSRGVEDIKRQCISILGPKINRSTKKASNC